MLGAGIGTVHPTHSLSLSHRGAPHTLRPTFKIGVFYLKSRFLVFLGKVEGLSTNAHNLSGDSSGDTALAYPWWGVGSSMHPSACSAQFTRLCDLWTFEYLTPHLCVSGPGAWKCCLMVNPL